MENNIEKITLSQLEDMAHNKEWKEAVIVFKSESFDKDFPEKSRSYKVNSNSKYFNPLALGTSLYGYCLDGTDKGVRLDWYLKAIPEDNLGKRWVVDYCYIIEK